MCASRLPAPKGTSLMRRFIFTACAAGGVLPRYSLADGLGGAHPFIAQEGVLGHENLAPSLVDRSEQCRDANTIKGCVVVVPRRTHRQPRAQSEVEERPAAHRDERVHQLRHLHPPLPPAVRGHFQPRDRCHHLAGAVLGVREVPRALSGRLHLRRPDWAPAAEDWWEEPDRSGDPYGRPTAPVTTEVP